MLLLASITGYAQTIKMLQGMVLEKGTNIRLAGIQILNKRSRERAASNSLGVFSIKALTGDTLYFISTNFQPAELAVSDLADKVVFMKPVIQINEVIVKGSSVKKDIEDVQRGYREKSVFYTGTPHYYYLVLKPMTFIYENFKSEVIDARRFNRYAKQELASYNIASRFNDTAIKKVIDISDSDLMSFKLTYRPTLAQISSWNDYELINYIKQSFEDFK